MIMLSQLNRFTVRDENGKSAKLVDLALALLEEDYPQVTEILVAHEDKLLCFPWDDVLVCDPAKKVMNVADLNAGEESSYDAADGDVWLNHDILDSLVIDLANRTTTRATDLQLDDSDGQLRLAAVDAGIGAMLRRITGGRYKRVSEKQLQDWQYVEFLRGDPKAVKNGEGYRLRINRLSSGAIAQLSDYIPYLHAAELLNLLPDSKAAGVLEAMSVDRQLQVFEELDEKDAAGLLKRMASDHAADLIGRLPVETMRYYLNVLPRAQSENIVQLLQYPEDTVGGVMINDMLTFDIGKTIDEARDEAYRRLPHQDVMSVFFVVDPNDARRLRGSVALTDLVSEDVGDKNVEDIMYPYLETLNPFDSANDAAYRLVGTRLTAMPVTDSSGILLGVMTIGAAIRQMADPSSALRGAKVLS